VQESGLDPDVCSDAGACGIMQVMPGTWAEIEAALGWRNVSRRSAHHSIFGGVYYQARMDRIWARGRTIAERHALGLASYNAGPGSIIAAQAACNDAHLWPDIAPCLAAVTGTVNARQTTGYVRNIARWRMAIKGCRWRGHRGGCAPGGWI
jgi:membrane-bound lytic murein transglycosylase F